MTNLRFIGMTVAVMFMIVAFRYFRRNQIPTAAFLSVEFTGLIIAFICIFPDVTDILLPMLNMEKRQHARLIVLLLIAVAVLMVSVFLLYKRISYQNHLTSNIIFTLTKTSFHEDYPGFDGASVVILIPAYNEADNIANVIKSVPSSIDGMDVKILVVDDCSGDGTAERAKASGAYVARLILQLGGGMATQTGFSIIKDTNAQFVVTLDADGQHDPTEIGALLKKLKDEKADLAIGSRVLGVHHSESSIRSAGVYVFGRVISFLLGRELTDPSSGFRALRTDILSKLNMRQRQYHTSELIIDAVKKGANVVEAPITIRKRMSGESKKGGAIVYGLSFAKVILQTWLRTP